MEETIDNQMLVLNTKMGCFNLNGNNNIIQINSQIDNFVINGNDNKIFLSDSILNLLINGNSNRINVYIPLIQSENISSRILNIIVNGYNNNLLLNDINYQNSLKIDNGFQNSITCANYDNLPNSSLSVNNNHFNLTQILISNNNNELSSNLINEFMENFLNYPRSSNNTSSTLTSDDDIVKKKVSLVNTLEKAKYSNYKRKKKHLKEDTCTICLDKFKSRDILVIFACNQHIFHQNCLYEWLQNSNYCPLCKFDIMNM